MRDCRFALYEGAIRDTIERFEATDSPVVTDGKQRKYHNFLAYCVHMGFRTRSRMVSKSVIGRSYPPYVAAHARPLSLFALRRFVPGCGHALCAPAGQGGRDIAIGLESDVPSRRHSGLSVMVLRNSHPDATRFSAALSMIEIFDLGEPCVTPIRQLPHPYCVVDRIRGGRPRLQCGWPEPTPRACVRAQSAFFRAQSARNPPVADWSGKPFA